MTSMTAQCPYCGNRGNGGTDALSVLSDILDSDAGKQPRKGHAIGDSAACAMLRLFRALKHMHHTQYSLNRHHENYFFHTLCTNCKIVLLTL